MRKYSPLAVVLALVLVGPLSAQFTVSGASIKNGSNTNAASSGVPTIGLGQMIPRMNMGQAVPNPFGGTKTLNFSGMLPSFSSSVLPKFSWMKTGLFPVRMPSSQIPTTSK